MEVGQIIKKYRKDKRMTLSELSQKSGVALATLSRMENGKMTGTLESHINICKALEVTLTDLYRDLPAARKTVEVQQKDARADVFVHDRRTSAEMLASNILAKKMMPVLVRIKEGGATHKEETKPGVERFVYVLSGKIDASVGEEIYQLTKSDTLYFEASSPHFFKNSGKEEAALICVSCPPTL